MMRIEQEQRAGLAKALWPNVEFDGVAGAATCTNRLEHSDLRVIIADGTVRPLEDRRVPPVGMVEFYFQVEGEAALHRQGQTPRQFAAGQSAVLRHLPSSQSRWSAPGNGHNGFVSISCRAEFFDLLVDSGARPQSPILDGDAVVLSPTINRLAEDLYRPHHDTPLRDLQTRARVIEIVCAGAHLITRSSVERLPVQLSERDVARLYQTKNVIRSQLCAAPTIPELARLVGLNQQKLKVGFKSMFGQTIFAFTLEERMNTARKLLEERALPVKTVAYNVGYQCPTSFSRAFERHWGFLPRAIKRANAMFAGPESQGSSATTRCCSAAF